MGATSAVFSQPTYQPTYVQGGSTIISPQPATTIQTQGSVASIVRPATTTVGTTSLSPTHQTTIGTPVGTVASIGQPAASVSTAHGSATVKPVGVTVGKSTATVVKK